VWAWVSFLASLNLTFRICKAGITVSMFQGCRENKMKGIPNCQSHSQEATNGRCPAVVVRISLCFSLF
jgi:hypothetical protein